MHDTLIRNGKVVDGTGAKAFIGDVAIKDGVIVDVGEKLEGRAKREIDADGHLVTPGWVDAHTHFDGQASWDPYLTPSSNQGTTTVVMGNCGVGFAPCKPDEHEMLISVMEDVEDIPGAALTEGITWEWESFPEYLDALDVKPRAIDVGSQVPHCAVRCYVMGDRAAKNEEATPEDIAQMADIVRDGLRAGAVGFTTSRTKLHITKQGEVMPGTYAAEDELLGIGKALGDVGSGVYGLVSDFDDWEREMDWMKRLSIDTGRPVNYVLFHRYEKDFPRLLKQLEYSRKAEKDGAQLIPHVGARPISIMMGWDATVHPFMFSPSYAPLAELPREERLRKLRDPATRAAILSDPTETPQSPIPSAQDMMQLIVTGYHNMYPLLEERPDYEPTPESSIGGIAERDGVNPRELLYDMMLRHDGKALLYFPNFGYETGDFSRQIELLKSSNTVISLADSGAHCGVLCDAPMPSFVLSYLARDRERGERLGLEEAVKMQTRDTAYCMSFFDRGTLEPGKKADINVIDFEKLGLRHPEVIFDLPAGGRRIYQEVDGYKTTMVSGVVTYADGEATGELPGRLIRGSRPAEAEIKKAS